MGPPDEPEEDGASRVDSLVAIRGARVTLWNFVAMALAVLGVLYFLPSGGSGA